MHPTDADRPVPALRITNAVVHGEEKRPILQIPLLEITPGTKIGIRGPSGAGKSTLLHLMSGLVLPATGRVLWDATELSGLPESKRDAFRQKHFGLIFQEALLLEELNAVANACIAADFAPPAARRAIMQNGVTLLERLGVPSGKRRVDTYSGGERQRVAVARALAADPPVILADEPTAALDRENADKLLQDLLTIVGQDNKTLVMVSHDRKVLAAMDRVIDILDGAMQACPEKEAAP